MLSREFILRNDQNAQSLWAFLKQNWRACATRGNPLSVTVAEWKAKRSAVQNKRYWSILDAIAANAWCNGRQYPSEVWHELVKRKFIGCAEMPDGSVVGLSSTNLSTTEFAEFSDKIEAYAITELGIEFNIGG